MPRQRFHRITFQPVLPHQLQEEEHKKGGDEKQHAHEERRRIEAEQRQAAKEAQALEEKRQLIQQRIRTAIEREEITEAEAALLPDLDESALVHWAHTSYIDQITRLKDKMDRAEWKEVCLYLSDKKDFSLEFANFVKTLFPAHYQFELHQPHPDPYRLQRRFLKLRKEGDNSSEFTIEPWADNLYDACAPHWVVTVPDKKQTARFGIMTIWRTRFTKHGLSMMARAQFIKTKLFEQETGIPIFMIFGIGGFALQPEQLFVIPFSEAENHFVPKPIAYRYEQDTHLPLYYIPELNKIRQ